MKIEADITIYCGSCNKELATSQDRYEKISVEPCADCMKNKREEGHDAGYEIGYDTGFNSGKDFKE